MLNFRLDQLSFWIGFAAASLFWWLLRQARPAFSLLGKALRERAGAVRAGLSVSAEQRFRQDAYGLYNREHLAAPLFSLMEVAVTPRLITPPPPVIPQQVLPPESITDIAIPYLPDMPIVSSHFNVKTISIPEVMSRGADLLLMGPPGSGRSFALYHLAALAAQRHPDAGGLGELIPFCFHAGDLDQSKIEHPADAIYHIFAEQVSLMAEASLDDFIEKTLKAGAALILVDGLDDLPKPERQEIVRFLEILQERCPGNRYMVSTSPHDLTCQESLNLVPFAIAGWDSEQKSTFIQQWSRLWTDHIAGQTWAGELPDIYDPLILNAWLAEETQLTSPLTLTLKTWATYAGDSRGPEDLDAMEAYLRRMSAGIKNARPALENLAAQSVLNQTPYFPRGQANSYIAEFEVEPEAEAELAEAPGDLDDLLDEMGVEEPDAVMENPNEQPGVEDAILDDEELESLLDEIDRM
ncbi:MAG: NACHT domain-containing protein, partial [Anaerolineales bacterium]